MIITTLSNKSVCITSDMPHEAPIVAQYRQFKIGEKILRDGRQRTILDVDTIVDNNNHLHNVYMYYSRDTTTVYEVLEYYLLKENAKPCPVDIFDLLVDVLPPAIPFTAENGVFSHD